MLFMATICFQCATSSPEIQALRTAYSKELRKLQLKYNSHQAEARCSYDGGYPCASIEVSFHAERELHRVEAAHWLSMTLQGLAGLYSVCLEGVDSFSYSYSIEFNN